jgi:hypothetical protein
MKLGVLGLAAIFSLAQAAPTWAQDHLLPDPGVFGETDAFLVQVRLVFAQAFEEGVLLRAVVIPSFEKEYAVGLRETAKGCEVFLLTPSTQIWNTELIRDYERGELRCYVNGKPLPLKDDKNYQRLKANNPSDYKDIRVTRQSRPVPKDLADNLRHLWNERLLEVEDSDELDGQDGETYYFSLSDAGSVPVSGHIWSPKPDSKVGRLVAVVPTLADFASGKADAARLAAQIERATKK